MASGADSGRVPPKHQHQPIADGAQPGKPPPQQNLQFSEPLKPGSVDEGWPTFEGAKSVSSPETTSKASPPSNPQRSMAGWPTGLAGEAANTTHHGTEG